jgi:hypothetical protein
MPRKLFILLTMVLCTSVAFGQDSRGGHRHNHGGNRGSSGHASRRADPTTAAFLRRVDTNGNGMIDEDEVTGGAKTIVEGILTRLGVKLKYPIPLSNILPATGGGRRGNGDDADSSSESKPSADTPATPSAQGFDKPKQSAPDVPGFGQPSDQQNSENGKAVAVSTPAAAVTPSAAASSATAPAASGSSADSPKPTGPKSGRFLTPHERLSKDLPDWFREKDTNGDGQVDMAEYASEWTAALVEEFNRYDLNHDGVITQAECLKAEGSRHKSK